MLRRAELTPLDLGLERGSTAQTDVHIYGTRPCVPQSLEPCMTPRRLFAFAAPGALALALSLPVAAEAQGRSAQAPARAAAAAVASTQRPVTFVAQTPAAGGVLVLPLAAEGDLATRAGSLAPAEGEALARALTSAKFTYGEGKTLTLRGVGAWDAIHVVGLGDKPAARAWQAAGAVAGRALRDETGGLTVLAGGLSAEAAAEFAIGLGLGEYRSDFYQAKARERAATGPITVVSEAAPAAEALYRPRGAALVAAMAWALRRNTSVMEFFCDRNAVAQPEHADPLFVHALRVNPNRPDRSNWLLGVDYNNDYVRLTRVSHRLGHPTMQDLLLVQFIDLADVVS